MKKSFKILGIVLAVAAVLGLAACSNQKPVEGGQTLTVRLEYNAGTGYEWRNSVGTDEKNHPLDVVDMYTEDAAAQGVVGGPLVDVMVFKPAYTGKTHLVYMLARAWELDENASVEELVSAATEELPEGTIVIEADVEVAEDGTITVSNVEPSEYASWFVVE